MMTICHQRNLTRVEEAQNNARRAVNVVLVVSLPKHCMAKKGYLHLSTCLEGKVSNWVGERPESKEMCSV